MCYMKKKHRRSKWLSIRVTPHEHRVIEKASIDCDSASSWARRLILSAAYQQEIDEAKEKEVKP